MAFLKADHVQIFFAAFIVAGLPSEAAKAQSIVVTTPGLTAGQCTRSSATATICGLVTAAGWRADTDSRC